MEFAGCRVEALVGRGGMGVIYRATDLRLERLVAIKLIATDRASDRGFRRRFEREARLTAAIDHPNVIPVYAAGEENGHLYLVMRYVAGLDLQALLRREGRLSAERSARLVEQVAAALDAAHAAGLVHRDIKPANVLLAGDHVYLSDFGITRADSGASVTDTGEWLGTVDFMSPEHLRGERTTPRSDVYAVGCLLHCCLTGKPPFQRSTPAATILAHLDDVPPRASASPGVPAGFDDVIARALAKDPAERYASAGELGRAARAVIADRPVAAAAGKLAHAPLTPRRASATAAAPTSAAAASNGQTAEAPTRVLAEPEETVALTRARRLPRWPIRIGLTGLCAVALVVAVVLLSSGGQASGPLSASEVAGAANSFARAYAHEDAGALARLLAPDVARVSPTGVERGRAAVLAEYRRQFSQGGIEGYRLTRVSITPGWVGRLSASYTVPRAGGRAFGGTVVFGVRRLNGRAVIGLIATQPQG
jgi:hypothetical protein